MHLTAFCNGERFMLVKPIHRFLKTRIFLLMKLTSILLLAAFMQVSAAGYSQRVTISGENLSLRKVFGEIEKQSGYSFFYSDKDLRKAKLVSLHAQNIELLQLLNQIFQGQPLTYNIIDKTIVVKEKTGENFPSDANAAIDVNGRVINEKDEGLEGITVSVKGTQNGTATDAAGNFLLHNVDQNATLVFTGINVENKEISVNGRSNLNIIRLKIKISLNEEVTITVNTGYQSLSKERSAGSYSKPNLDIAKNRSTSMNILQRLDGLVPGLTINNAPNSETILIRGLSSINGNRAPLYVVDGISMNDVSSINPQDIADITVLKDATAASIWGAKASNGVVVIVTKKGSADEKIRINYDGFINFNGKPDLKYIPVLNSQQYIQSAKEIFDPAIFPWTTVSAFTNTGSIGVPPHEMILYNQYRGLISAAQANNSLDSLASIRNNQQIGDLWYRNAALRNHTISLAGGGKVHSFYGSLSYTGNQSNRPGEKNNTYKANLRQDFNLNKHLQAYLITDLTSSNSNSPRNINIDNRFYPYQLFQDANGNNLSVPYIQYLSDSTRMAYQNLSRINLDYNPLNEVNYGYTKNDALLNRLIGGVTVKFIKGLRYEGVFGYIKGNNKTTNFDNANAYLVRSELVQFTVAPNTSSTPVYYLPSTGGRYSVANLMQRNWTVRNQMVYDNSWNDKLHQLVLLAGQEAQDQLTNTNAGTVRGYNELLQTYGAVDYATLSTTGVPSPVMVNNIGKSILITNPFSQTETETRFTSYYANAAYTYKRKYSVNGSWRIDKSNLFGVDRSAQNRPVWSFGGKWIASDESFLKSAYWLNNLALRATYGITGNSPSPGQAASFDILRAASNSFFPGGVGLTINTPGNAKLTWESTETINLGLDFSVLKNRLYGSIDVYRKNTSNLLGSLSVNSFTGYSSIFGNFGDLQNKGIELSLTSTNVSNKSFLWQTIFTAAYNKNIITNLVSATPVTTGELKLQQQYLTGFPAFAVFGYRYAGLDTLGDPMIYVNDKTATKARNAATPNDVAYMGTYQPVWSGGLSNIISYKGFGLSVNAVYNLGNVMRRDVNQFYTGRLIATNASISPNAFTTGNVNAEFVNRWKKPGDEQVTIVPSYVSNASLSSSRRDVTYYTKADLNVVSASYIKLRDVTLSYSLPKAFLDRIKTNNITFRVQLSNLMLWKANKYGIDPEFQDAFYGIRNVRSNQQTITVGAHVTL
jgi:TonB-linked SusC/RagA family outer membrane protein